MRLCTISNLKSSIVFLKRDGNEYLSASRKDNGKIAVTGGKSEKDETPSETSIRELFEETGVLLDEKELIFIFKGCDKNNYMVHSFFAEFDPYRHREPFNKEEDIHVSWESDDSLCIQEVCDFYRRVAVMN